MGRVLAPDVARQLGSSNPYVRKKAALALIRILKRLPELCDEILHLFNGLWVRVGAVQFLLS